MGKQYEDRKLTASFINGGQSGPDSYETWIETFHITPETRIAEIMDWYFRKCKHLNRVISIQINEPDI